MYIFENCRISWTASILIEVGHLGTGEWMRGILTGAAVVAGRLLGIDIDVNHWEKGHGQYEKSVG